MARLRHLGSARAKLATATVIGALLAAPIAVLASHQFVDVPSNHPFHHEIGALADAGIARGFPGGFYQPSSNITRQAMAAFIERAVGRAGVGFGSGSIGNGDGLPRRGVIAEVSISAGATGAGTTGFVVLIGTGHAFTATPTACPCFVQLGLAADGSVIADMTGFTIPGDGDEIGDAHGTATVHAMVPISGDQSKSFQLVIENLDYDIETIAAAGQLTALYVPLGPDGDDTSAYESSCTEFEVEPNHPRDSANTLSDDCVIGVFDAGDSDYYAVSVAAGQTLTLETRSMDGAGCGGDTYLELHDADGTVLESDENDGIGTCSLILRSGLAAGLYYVHARAMQPYQSFNYSLRANQAP